MAKLTHRISQDKKARVLALAMNLIAFQCSWFACMIYGNWALPVVGLLLVAHYRWVSKELSEWRLIAGVGALGFAVDFFNSVVGLLHFRQFMGLLPPLWLLALWLLFATTLRHSLAWLLVRSHQAVVLGALAGPLTYWAGVELGAGYFSSNVPLALAVIALEWGLLMGVLCWWESHRYAEQ